MNIVELTNVSKSYGRGATKNEIFINIDLTVESGDFVVLKGANGVGKTTLASIILGTQKVDDGVVRLFGLQNSDPKSRANVGTMLQDSGISPNVTIEEGINLFQSYYDAPLKYEEILKRANLDKDDGKREISSLSGGYKQRFFFSLAVAGNPTLLVLDEPTKFLDHLSYNNFWEQLCDFYNSGKTVILITHSSSDELKIQELGIIVRTLVIENRKVMEVKSHQPGEELLVTKLSPVTVATLEKPSNAYKTSTHKRDIQILFSQIKFELLDLKRRPAFWLSMIFLSFPAFFFPSKMPPDFIKLLLACFCCFNLWTISDKYSIALASEISLGWTKLLRTTPLPAWVYFASKLLIYIITSLISIVILLNLGVVKTGLEASFAWWMILPLSLLFGSVPFVLFKFYLSCLIKPKSLSVVSTLLLTLAFLGSGAASSILPNSLRILLPYLPSYHYGQLILQAVGFSNHDKYLFIHMAWLIWITVALIPLLLSSYQSDQTDY